MLVTLVLLPAVVALLLLFVENTRTHRLVNLGVAVLHFVLVLSSWGGQPIPALGSYLALDELGHLFLSISTVLYLGIAVYSTRYFDTPEHPTPRHFIPCLLAVLSTMTLVESTQHLALLWVGVEATTLATAPLIYSYQRKEALEAAWKYLLICSVGIALALLGTFCVGIAGTADDLTLSALQTAGTSMSPAWLKTGFICALVGYGTKMGLVPLHTWLPDAHSQAPSPVSALMSGTLLNCALLALLRFYQITIGAGEGAFARDILLLMGFVSILVPIAFMLGQQDYKRLLAYSSIENIGVITVGIGLGGAAVSGALLHALNHSLIKGALFMLAGNLLRRYQSTRIDQVKGASISLPGTGRVLFWGILAIGGTPPFGTFMSEFTIFQAAIQDNRIGIGVMFVVGLALCALTLALGFLPALFGPPPENMPHQEENHLFTTVLPSAVFCILALLLGLWIPAPLGGLLQAAAAGLGG